MVVYQCFLLPVIRYITSNQEIECSATHIPTTVNVSTGDAKQFFCVMKSLCSLKHVNIKKYAKKVIHAARLPLADFEPLQNVALFDVSDLW